MQIFKISNNTLFDICFERNCVINIFLRVDRGRLGLLSTLPTEHGCTAEKQHPWKQVLRVLFLRSAPVLSMKRTQQGNLPQSSLGKVWILQLWPWEKSTLSKRDDACMHLVYLKRNKHSWIFLSTMRSNFLKLSYCYYASVYDRQRCPDNLHSSFANLFSFKSEIEERVFAYSTVCKSTQLDRYNWASQ